MHGGLAGAGGMKALKLIGAALAGIALAAAFCYGLDWIVRQLV